MQFDPFIIPFNIGLYFIIIYAVVRCIIWFRELSRPDKLRLQRGFFGAAFVQSLKEIFMESLIHRKILKTRFRLGYMHMSLAFGWFLLILFGTIEADVFGTRHLNAPYRAIFFRFFNPEHGRMGLEAVYGFLMDLILAFILSGLLLAVFKRFYSRIVGMKKTTRLRLSDKVALTALWLIFPSRLLAESFTCGVYGTGSFLTGSLGTWMASFLPAEELAYPFWWLYSLSLGTFFILLPVTRYMHIPTELFLIFMRNSGIRTGDRTGAYSEVEVYSCSSCGLCIDTCQLNTAAGITSIQSAYLMRSIRNNNGTKEIADNCLMCGRCDQVCPVGIELSPIRMIQRRETETSYRNAYRGYFRTRQTLAQEKTPASPVYNFLPERNPEHVDVIYFAGCMTHLTPGIKESMIKILDASGLNYSFIDEQGGACCGRPLMLAGLDREARELINYNSQLIWKTGAQTLVTSCPICYKVFRESYYLDVQIMHHSQFIKELIDTGDIRLKFLRKKVVYHTPCDLGRGSGVYDEPRYVLRHVSRLEKTNYEDADSLCCGGSLANMKISQSKRRQIAAKAADELTISEPDLLVTACPLCKKSFASATETRVTDIAEVVAEALMVPPVRKVISRKILAGKELADII
jgi:Fe-S oxidoreductase